MSAVPVEFTCDHCGKRLRVKDESAGKKVKCPGCQNIVQVPKDEWYLKAEDGNDYGPVPKTELDQWFTEGRVTPQCQILQDGWQQWKWATDVYPQLAQPAAPSSAPIAPVGTPVPTTPAFPGAGVPQSEPNPFDFATASTASAAKSQASSAGSEELAFKNEQRRRVAVPAIAMLVIGGLSALMILASGILNYVNLQNAMNDPDVRAQMEAGGINPDTFGGLIIVGCLVGIGIQSFIIYAAMGMKNLRGWGLAVAASVLFIPGCLCPLGIWFLVVLMNEDVKKAFRMSSKPAHRRR
jgi:phage FluMu protein Com